MSEDDNKYPIFNSLIDGDLPKNLENFGRSLKELFDNFPPYIVYKDEESGEFFPEEISKENGKYFYTCKYTGKKFELTGSSSK